MGTGFGDSPVLPDSLTICAYCGELLWFGEDLQLRKLTARELLQQQLSPHWPQTQLVQKNVKDFSEFYVKKGGKFNV